MSRPVSSRIAHVPNTFPPSTYPTSHSLPVLPHLATVYSSLHTHTHRKKEGEGEEGRERVNGRERARARERARERERDRERRPLTLAGNGGQDDEHVPLGPLARGALVSRVAHCLV